MVLELRLECRDAADERSIQGRLLEALRVRSFHEEGIVRKIFPERPPDGPEMLLQPSSGMLTEGSLDLEHELSQPILRRQGFAILVSHPSTAAELLDESRTRLVPENGTVEHEVSGLWVEDSPQLRTAGGWRRDGGTDGLPQTGVEACEDAQTQEKLPKHPCVSVLDGGRGEEGELSKVWALSSTPLLQFLQLGIGNHQSFPFSTKNQSMEEIRNGRSNSRRKNSKIIGK